ncbi:HVA22-like protein k [Turnera subulata]|uniref:HVA22-like protein n=1 Tax=Turnera subulata TaxID=218843 RepID=A0A9Q0FQ64_9ROSI|nr:HVA22-like protein k [Turnera subulata]
MAFLGANLASEVGLRFLVSPVASSNIVIRTACCSVGVVLPVYSTFKAIEKKDVNEQQKWLMYWAAYGSFTLVEVFADKFLYWFPMYYHVKFAFLVWLQLPTMDGAKHIYLNHLRPFFLRHQAKADLLIDSAYGEMVRLISSHQAEIQYVRKMLLKLTGSDDRTSKRALNQLEEHHAETISDTESDHDD